MRSSYLLLLLLVACAPEDPTFGGLTLATSKTTFSIKVKDKALLESSTVVAPVATRIGKARWEEQYGSFKITDNNPTWTEAKAFSWDEGQVTKTSAKGTWKDASGAAVVRLTASSTATGDLAITYTAADPATNRLSLAFSCADADRFLGFGAQADGIDHHGHTVAMWTSEPGIGKQMTDDEYPEPLWFLVGTRHASSFGLPTWVSNRGYQGLVGSDARSVFEVCSKQSDVFRIEVWSNKFTLWLYEGSPARTVGLATGTVLGRPMRPPPMAFAPWNDAIFGPAEVRRVAALLRDNHIPSSALWTEDFRGGTEETNSYRLVEEWDTDRTLYPDPEGLAAELQDGGFGWQAYFNTFVVDGTRISAEAIDGGHLVGSPDGGAYLFSGPTFKPTGMADLSRPETREWVKSYLRKALDIGFTGWMADYGEWLPHDAVLASGEDPLQAHNRYAREWSRLNQEVMDERTDGKQRVFFARAGWLGSNSVTPVVWAGDQRTSFQKDDGLPTVIPMGINLGMAGVSMYAHDVAGYQSATNPPSTKELFFRWVSLGALTPVMRTHHGLDARHNWKLDSDAETLAHYKRWAQFHIQLYPYLDAHSAEAEQSGVPIVRGLPMSDPADDRGWTISDEYFLGAALLVAPVIEEGAVARSVYLPAGDWVSWDGVTRVTGPADVTVAAPVGELPIFLRKGTCIPRLPSRVETLLDAAPPTVDLKDVEAERSLFVVSGGVSDFLERDGTRYVVIPGDATGFLEAGIPMPDCTAAERGCVDRSGQNPVARPKAGKPLDFPGGYLTITAPVERAYDVEVLQ